MLSVTRQLSSPQIHTLQAEVFLSVAPGSSAPSENFVRLADSRYRVAEDGGSPAEPNMNPLPLLDNGDQLIQAALWLDNRHRLLAYEELFRLSTAARFTPARWTCVPWTTSWCGLRQL